MSAHPTAGAVERLVELFGGADGEATEATSAFTPFVTEVCRL
jgi:Mn-containing catalase